MLRPLSLLFPLFILTVLVPRMPADDPPSVPETFYRVRSSKPVIVNKAEFAIIAETKWRGSKSDRLVPAEIQFRITNHAKNDVLFLIGGAVGLVLKDDKGHPVRPQGGRDHLISMRPVVVAEGESFTLCRRAEVHWDARRNVTELLYWDGSGGEYRFGPLHAGNYQLAIWYGVNARFAAQVGTKMNVEPWSGEVTTNEVVIEVIDG